MATNDYQFITHWRVLGLNAKVYDILADASGYLRWWSQVYLEVTVVKPAGEHGLGGVFDLHTRGKLPYTLRWRARVSETNYPHGFSIEAAGDFVGRGTWIFTQDRNWVAITFGWRLRPKNLCFDIFRVYLSHSSLPIIDGQWQEAKKGCGESWLLGVTRAIDLESRQNR